LSGEFGAKADAVADDADAWQAPINHVQETTHHGVFFIPGGPVPIFWGKGDGSRDDMAAIQHGIDTHGVLYFPSGLCRLTASVRLHPDCVLVGFNPFTTQ